MTKPTPQCPYKSNNERTTISQQTRAARKRLEQDLQATPKRFNNSQ